VRYAVHRFFTHKPSKQTENTPQVYVVNVVNINLAVRFKEKMQKNIIVQKVSYKDGTGAKGHWNKTGIMDADNVWYSTFNKIDVKEGGQYNIEYEESNGFNNIKNITPAGGNTPAASDNRQNSIIRQHSQEMALRYFSITQEGLSLESLVKIIDWFEADANSKELPF
jgi:hypothetical protein